MSDKSKQHEHDERQESSTGAKRVSDDAFRGALLVIAGWKLTG